MLKTLGQPFVPSTAKTGTCPIDAGNLGSTTTTHLQRPYLPVVFRLRVHCHRHATPSYDDLRPTSARKRPSNTPSGPHELHKHNFSHGQSISASAPLLTHKNRVPSDLRRVGVMKKFQDGSHICLRCTGFTVLLQWTAVVTSMHLKMKSDT